jgi:hypothetical protein
MEGGNPLQSQESKPRLYWETKFGTLFLQYWFSKRIPRPTTMASPGCLSGIQGGAQKSVFEEAQGGAQNGKYEGHSHSGSMGL